MTKNKSASRPRPPARPKYHVVTKPVRCYLPHIDYTVTFRPFEKPPETLCMASSWIRREDRNACTIFVNFNETPGGIAHEVVHALRYMCHDRHMTFVEEAEHMAYLMQYLLGRALGFEWWKD